MKTLFLILAMALVSSAVFAGGKEVKGQPEKTTTKCDFDRKAKGDSDDSSNGSEVKKDAVATDKK